MILVTGGGGSVGKAVVECLRRQGKPFRVLMRDPDAARRLAGPAVETVVGDFLDRPGLGAALEGVDRLFLLTPNDPRQVKMAGNVLHAARASGVRRVVKLSAAGADLDSELPISRLHAQVENKISDMGFDYTHLRPPFFMQNTLNYAPGIRAVGEFFAPAGLGKAAMIDVRDVAAVAAAVLTGDGHGGKTYEPTGGEAISFDYVANSIAKAIGKTVRYRDIPPEAARQAMVEKAGLPPWMADNLVLIFAAIAAGRRAKITTTVKDLLGREPIGFDEFAADHRVAFGG